MSGCCADRDCTPNTWMTLPDGKTCGDCGHLRHCVRMYDVKPENTDCDFFPRRFAQRAQRVPPPLAPIYDEVFAEGARAIDALAFEEA